MTMTVFDRFPPLQGAITQAESWTRYLHDREGELGARWPEELVASAEDIVQAGIHVGELLPITWRLVCERLFRPGEGLWSSVRDFEAVRQAIRRMFFTAREAMDCTRKV